MRLLTYFPLLLLGIFASLSGKAQSGCLQDWAYVRTVNINNVTGNQLNDFQVRLTFNSQALISAGKMNADGSDIRFTTSDCCTELPVWIQSGINTTTTRVWTRVPTVPPSGSVQIRMYYGNAGAPLVEHIDSVMFVLGNDSVGTSALRTNVTITSQQYTFAVPARTVRWRIYSADTARFKFKVANDTNMVTGTSPFFTTPPAPGFYTFDWEGQVVQGGYPGFYSTDTMRIMNTCATSLPCPGTCGDLTFGNGDLVIFGALDSVICGSFPSLRLWYRRSTFFDPTVSLVNNEFDRTIPFPAAATGPTAICPGDSVQISGQGIAASSYQWFRDGILIPGATDTNYTAYYEGQYYCVGTFGICQTVISDTVAITVNRPGLDLGPDITLCTDSSITVDAGAGFSSYLWNDGSTLQTLVIDTSGVYSAIVSDSAGCTAGDSIMVNLFPLPTPELVPNGPVNFCNGGSVTLDAFNPDWFAYIWNVAGVTSSNYVVDTPGSFFVVVYDLNGCTDTSETITVTVYPDPVLDLGNDSVLCDGDSVQLDAGSDWASIMWSWGYTGRTYDVTFSGLYVAEIVDTNGCIDDDSVFINFVPLPEPDLGANQIICPSATVQLDAGPDYVSYAWSNGDATQVSIVGEGYYRVTVTDTNGCVGSSAIVTIDAYPQLATPTIAGDADGMSASTASNYQWYRNGLPLPGETNQTYDPDSSGDYQVMVGDPNGCDTLFSNILSITIIFELTAEDIPEGFSPNGDGINDYFTIRNLGFFSESSLQVFNRWGQLVFERQRYDGDFNGRSDAGTELPDGTYFYILDVGDDRDPFTGPLIINR